MVYKVVVSECKSETAPARRYVHSVYRTFTAAENAAQAAWGHSDGNWWLPAVVGGTVTAENVGAVYVLAHRSNSMAGAYKVTGRKTAARFSY